jgi:peptidoglycan/LPS O-acetylase OafA/YrhL
MRYRSEIDGLRAIAVVPVVLFHAGISFFSGGYVGVDIFFVISGFLITSIILDEIASKRFSLIGFYERRIRRIIPALYFVVSITAIASFAFFSPFELEEFSLSLISVLLYVSNIFFWKNSGYFETQSEFNPLLHTWSLSVEEQFYIFLPLLLIFSYRFFGRNGSLLLSLIFISSLLLSHWASNFYPSANFYLLPTRAWELLAGSLLAIEMSKKKFISSNSVLSSAGLLLIAVSVFFFDENTPFPSLFALVPVLGTVLLIRFSDNEMLIGRVLSSGPLVFIGTISYSFYLVHQPIFSFARRLQLGSYELPVLIVLSFISCLVAYYVWRFVETPFRNRRAIKNKTLFLAFFSSTIILLAIGFSGFSSQGLYELKTTESQRALVNSAYPSPKREACHTGGFDYLEPNDACKLGGERISWALFGDSHGVELAYALGNSLGKSNEGVYQLTFSGCVPKYNTVDDGTPCWRWTHDSVKMVSNTDEISHVVIVYRINSALFGPHELSYPEIPRMFSKEVRERRWGAFKAVIGELAKNKKVFLILQPPELPRHVRVLIENGRNSGSKVEGVKRDWWNRRAAYVYNRIEEIGSISSNIEIIDPVDLFCDSEYCYAARDGEALYFDDDHISVPGAARLVSMIRDRID